MGEKNQLYRSELLNRRKATGNAKHSSPRREMAGVDYIADFELFYKNHDDRHRNRVLGLLVFRKGSGTVSLGFRRLQPVRLSAD